MSSYPGGAAEFYPLKKKSKSNPAEACHLQNKNGLILDFSTATLNARRQWSNVLC